MALNREMPIGVIFQELAGLPKCGDSPSNWEQMFKETYLSHYHTDQAIPLSAFNVSCSERPINRWHCGISSVHKKDYKMTPFRFNAFVYFNALSIKYLTLDYCL